MFTHATALTPSELKSAIVRDPLVVTRDTTVMDVITQMSGMRTRCLTTTTADGQLDEVHLEARSSCALVVEQGKLLGIMTERDVVRLSAQQQALETLTIGEVMACQIVTLRESAFTDLLFAVSLLQQHRIRHLPLLDDRDCLVGLVTHESLRQIARPVDLLRLRLVSEVMTSEVICASPESSMLTIVRQMARHRVSSIMIVRPAEGQPGDHQPAPLSIPVGIVTERDIVQFQALGLNLEIYAAEAVMSTPIFAVRPQDSLLTVQQVMEQHLIRRLAVTGEQGQLLGIVTQTSLLNILNPLELYRLTEVLETKVMRLEAEKRELLQTRATELEQQVAAQTAELRVTAKREQLVAEIATQIRSSLSLQTILDTTVTQIRQVLGCDRVNIWQFAPDWQTTVVAESTDSPRSLIGEQITDTCFQQEQAEVYRQGHIRVVPDIYTINMTDCHREMLIRLQTRAKILVPLLCGENLWGLLNATESQHPREWQPEEVELLRALSVQLAIALQQATAHQQLQEELIKRQQTEVRLRENEQQYMTLTAAAPVGIFRTDAQGYSIYSNPRCCELLGLSPEATAGHGWQRSLHPDDREQVIAETIRSRQGHRPFQLEYRILRPDGSIIWVLGQAVAERDSSGQVVGYVGTLTDISDQKAALYELQQAELALQKSEAKSRAVLEAIPDLMIRLGADGVYREMITPQREFDAVPQAFDRVGRLVTDVLPANIAQQYLHYLNLALETGELQVYEHQIQVGDRWQDEEVRVIKSGDDEVLFIIRDISEQQAARRERQQAEIALQQLNQNLERQVAQRTAALQASEAANRATLDAIPDLLLRLRRDGACLEYIKPGVEGDNFLPIAQHLAEVLPPDLLQTQLQMIEQAIVTRELQVYEHQFLKNGHMTYEEIRILAIDDQEVLAIVRDISDRKQAEQTIQHQAEREKLLREITLRIRQSLDLQTIFDTACQEIRQMLQADRVGVFKFYPDSGFDDGEFVAEARVEGVLSVTATQIHDHCFGEKYAPLYVQGRYAAMEDIYQLEQCHTDVLAQIQVRANLVMPLLCGNELWGLLCIHQCSTTRQWQQDEIELTQQLATQLAIAIQQSNLFKQLQAELLVRQQAEAKIALQLRRQQALGEIIQHIRQSLDIDEILMAVTQQVREVLNGDRVIVFQLFPDGSSQIFQESVSGDLPALKDKHWDDEVWSQDILNHYWQNTPRIVADVRNDRWTDCLVDYNLEGRIQSKMVAPILQEVSGGETDRWTAPGNSNKLWGVLSIHACHEQRVWKETEAQLLQQIANQLAVAIQQASLFQQLQQELTERQRTQQQLTERNQQLAVSNEELARATRLKDEFLANMSHELRTPLNAILGMTEGLQEQVFGTVTEQQRTALTTVERSGTHLLELINDILDVAKIESGQIELDIAPTPIAPLCHSSLAFINQQALKKGIQVELKLQLNLPDLLVDERRTRQVLINLLNNAVKFTPEGGQIGLEVSLSPLPALEGTGGYLRIVVRDTGIGISAEHIPKLFQPFVQIDSALNRKYEGTGLGLALVKRIAELHGGQVALSSEVGVGSCFTIDLPCSPVAQPGSRTAPPLESTVESHQSELSSSPLILLAEDNAANISTISSYLDAKGYRLVLAKNGQEAIDLTVTHQPDLILMDIQMPEVDGLEAIRCIRANPQIASIPIIALTALAMPNDRQACLDAGATEYIAKPVKLKALSQTIQTLLIH